MSSHHILAGVMDFTLHGDGRSEAIDTFSLVVYNIADRHSPQAKTFHLPKLNYGSLIAATIMSSLPSVPVAHTARPFYLSTNRGLTYISVCVF